MEPLVNQYGAKITLETLWARCVDFSRLPPLTEEAAAILAPLEPDRVFIARVAVLFAGDDGFQLAFCEDGEFSNVSLLDSKGDTIRETCEPYLPAGWAPVPPGENYTAEQMQAMGFVLDPS